ncbi:MAG: hypothetical protein U0869_11650 [Chloroflexota bacterium]
MTLRPLIGQRRDRGARYLLLMIVAFAITVIATRLYLDLTGYPKIGGGGLHVAHLLWGGLLLVVGALLILLFVGRRALILSALAAGVGVGLFIDEVGKFLTETNDYFFAPAAPIIYGAVLLLLLVWLVAGRGTPGRNEATQAAIEALRDLADGRLTPADRDRVVERMRASMAGEVPTDLEGSLLAALAGPGADARLAQPGWIERGEGDRLLRRFLSDRVERWIIRIGLFLSVLSALAGVLIAIVILGGALPAIPDPTGPIEAPTEPIWALLIALVWIVVGCANGAALVMSLTGRHPRAMAVAQYAVLTDLVAGGLLNVYVSQVGALVSVLVQVVLLLLILDQRRRLREPLVAA